MVTVEEATRLIFDHTVRPVVAHVAIEQSVGRVLGESVTADRDFPPFNRVSMDGIAIRFDGWAAGKTTFRIEASQAAGEPPVSLTNEDGCIEVMTGAVLPLGCDTVIRYEDLEIMKGQAKVTCEVVERGQSVHRQGSDARKEEVLLTPGQILAPSEVALMASVGKSRVAVCEFPKIAVISTGDELVPIGEMPAPWQIRRSNSYAIQAALREMGCEAKCFHLPDDREVLRQGLEKVVADHDVLILSGGVSRGKFDYVPDSLEAIGIRKLFHQVRQRPGKPFWFGAGADKIAFALPGNPVSTFMCFYRYIRPWLLKTLCAESSPFMAQLGADVAFGAPMTYFLQVSVVNKNGVLVAVPVPGGGSGDFANLKNVNGFLELPPERSDFRSGEVFPLYLFRH